MARLASVYRLAGDQAAATSLNQALDVLQELNVPHARLEALTELGALQSLTGDHQAAAAWLTQALTLARKIGDRQGQACTLNHLGAVQAGTLSPAGGLARHTEALSIARDIGAPLEGNQSRVHG